MTEQPLARTVTMQTLIDYEGVLYTVYDGDPNEGDFGHAREVWRAFIPFGQTDRYVAAGPAFVAAAREQERQAQRLIDGGDA